MTSLPQMRRDRTPDYDAVVVGAGVQGLCAAYHLTSPAATRASHAAKDAPASGRNSPRVAIVEKHSPGHAGASSHGDTRITRTGYSDPVFVDLARRAHRVDWPELEAAAGRRLLVPCAGCFAGVPGGPWDEFRRTARETAGTEVVELARDEVETRYPMLHFADAGPFLEDRSAAVVLASRVMAALVGILTARGVEWIDGEVTELELGPGRAHLSIVVRSPAEVEEIAARRIVLAAGPWTSRLLPELRPRLTVIRQTVGYFTAPGVDLGRFPIWVWVGRTPSEFYYGLPEVHPGSGLKVARHFTSGRSDDPDGPAPTDLESQDALARFARGLFALPGLELLRTERCLYTMTADEFFLLDHHPDDPRIVVGAGFSGHGFKFAPLVGRILAELALHGRTTIEEFERHRGRFAWQTT